MAERSSKEGQVTPSDIVGIFKSNEMVVPSHPATIMGFGGDLAGRKQPQDQAQHSREGAGGMWDARQQSPAVVEVYGKVASGMLGNPHRLRRAFRTYDQDRKGEVTKSEFLQVGPPYCGTGSTVVGLGWEARCCSRLKTLSLTISACLP